MMGSVGQHGLGTGLPILFTLFFVKMMGSTTSDDRDPGGSNKTLFFFTNVLLPKGR